MEIKSFNEFEEQLDEANAIDTLINNVNIVKDVIDKQLHRNMKRVSGAQQKVGVSDITKEWNEVVQKFWAYSDAIDDFLNEVEEVKDLTNGQP